MDSVLPKFHDTIFIEADVDLIIQVHMAFFSGVFSVCNGFLIKKGETLATRIELDNNLIPRACTCFYKLPEQGTLLLQLKKSEYTPWE